MSTGPGHPRDQGSILPLVAGLTLLGLLLVAAVATASAAFLAQRDLQAICDSAALSAADALDEAAVYLDDAPADLPLRGEGVADAVEGYLAAAWPTAGLEVEPATDGRTVTLRCSRLTALPFGAVFGHSGGLRQSALSSARAPLTTPGQR